MSLVRKQIVLKYTNNYEFMQISQLGKWNEIFAEVWTIYLHSTPVQNIFCFNDL